MSENRDGVKGGDFASTLEAAPDYRRRKWKVVLVATGGKRPIQEEWQAREVDDEALADHCRRGGSIGIQTGLASELLDIDLDCEEATLAAPPVLPPTGLISGRPGAGSSHWFFKSLAKQSRVAYKDVGDDGAVVLLELRGENCQSVAPPSPHPDGGWYAWAAYGEPAFVEIELLLRRVAELAAAVLLSRHWPRLKARHDAYLPLAGALAHSGYEPEGAERIVRGVSAARRDEEGEDRLRAVRDTFNNHDGGRNVTGWPTLAGVVGEQVVARVREWLGLERIAGGGASRQAGAGDPPPHGAPPACPWPGPLGQEAYHGLAGEFVRVIAPASEADPVAILLQFLVGFGNLIGRTAHWTAEAVEHHGNEFAVVVGRTSKGRKGTSYGHVERVLNHLEEVYARERILSGLSSGEGLIWAVRDPATKRERVKERGEAVRYEEVEADPGVADKRMLVYEPEFANVLKQIERQSNILSTVLRNAWDGRTLRTLTKNSPAVATGAHVSLIGHITDEELRRCLSTTEAANGFGNRFLFACAKRSKLLPNGGRPDPEALERVVEGVGQAADFARTTTTVRRDDGAGEIWNAVYARLSEGLPGMVGALLGRAEAHVMRLAMLYALLDRSAVIQEPHLMAALALWQYCEESVRHIFGDSLGDPLADDLLRLLRAAPNGLSRTQIRDHFGKHRDGARIAQALALLAEHHLARVESCETGGRPEERWHAFGWGR
jgi:hypothetical protein